MEKTLLIVEDDRDIRETLIDLFRSEGYVVIAAKNGKEAMAALEAPPRPVLVLLDLMMPVMDGWTFLDEKNRRSEFSDIPVLGLSATRQSSPIHGVKEVLKKPIEPDLLCEKVAVHTSI